MSFKQKERIQSTTNITGKDKLVINISSRCLFQIETDLLEFRFTEEGCFAVTTVSFIKDMVLVYCSCSKA